ncbi:hypothetical protein JANAI62_30640 [Jannaschia pagri]|uniref:Uncharacterized protein n=1 Tax=Jannaschia pagri TaxID=2829797 RepID=A0ABQ4NPU6_9RHOB|nr:MULTISPECIES: hypothetical protein [unclassified Jannaschia]GIT92699.1 hypothetical protein JANAI61_31570 [Jannaschia sp. AI_61]GIT96441.1 hypothetical protein JANAI62_30640 [Jannaschia sp. AI_62]
MTKTFIAALIASAVALPVVAQTVKIEDDGWSLVEVKPAPTTTVDIDDDGWTRVSLPTIRSDRGAMGAPGTCTQLESSVGLSGDECGVMSLSEVAKMVGDD